MPSVVRVDFTHHQHI